MKRDNEFLYLKLANIIREQIVNGFIKPGQYILSENELCRQYELSRSSVRKALDELVEEGLITKKVGQGTIVAPDLMIPKEKRKTLKIMAPSHSFYADYCLPFILEAFQSKFPQVEVKILRISSLALSDLFKTSQQVGFEPDLLLVTDKQHQELMQESHDAFVDLRPHLATQLDDIYPKLIMAFSESDRVFSVPVSFSSVFLTYNPDMFREYGVQLPHLEWNTTDFLAAAKKLTRDTDKDGIADICGFSLPISLGRWPAIAIANGVRFQKDQRPEGILKTLSFFHDILFRYRVATLAVRSWLNSEAFVREKSGMVLSTTFEMASWKQSGIRFEPQIAPLPFVTEQSPMLIGNSFMVPCISSDTELAAQLILVALSPEVQEKIAQETGFLSVLQSVNEATWDNSQLQAMSLTVEAIERGFFLHELLPDFSLAVELDQEMEMFWSGLESAESFAERYSEIMDRNS